MAIEHVLRIRIEEKVIKMSELTLDRRIAAHKDVVWQHGLIGGAIGGLLMGAFAMIAMAATGDGFFRPLELIGSIWWGAMTTGTAVIVAGLLTHMAVSMVLGLLYSYLFPFAKVDPLVLGLVYGAVVWFLAQIVVLPQVAAYISDGFTVWMFLAAHLVFGASLGFFEDLADRRGARRGRREVSRREDMRREGIRNRDYR